MKRVAIVLVALLAGLFLNGCVFANECGYSTYLYNECVEYYDAQGIYHKVCPRNNLSNRCEAPPREMLLGDCIGCN